jgi:hypothetical protein
MKTENMEDTLSKAAKKRDTAVKSLSVSPCVNPLGNEGGQH